MAGKHGTLGMPDPIVILTPVLLLAIVALLAFRGCDLVFTVPDRFLPITIVQKVGKFETLDNDTIATAFPAEVTAGHLIVVWISYNSAVQTVSKVSDSANNNYVSAIPTPAVPAVVQMGRQQEIWYATATTGGPNLSVTALFKGAFNALKAIGVHEYQNVVAESPLGQAFLTSGTTANASVGPNPVNANELVFGAAVFVGGNGNAGDGFTQQLELSGNLTEDKLLAAPGPITVTFKNGLLPWIAAMVTFKPVKV